MIKLNLKIGDANTNAQDEAIMMFGISSVLQWLFFIVVAIIIIAKYIKRKNADSDNKHS